jgi:hypothetical protein
MATAQVQFNKIEGKKIGKATGFLFVPPRSHPAFSPCSTLTASIAIQIGRVFSIENKFKRKLLLP